MPSYDLSVAGRRRQRRASILLDTWTAAQRVDLLITNVTSEAGVWTPHFALLSMICINDPMTPTELAGRMGLRPTTTSDYVQRLVDLGHIERVPNPSDGRSYLITPTERGWEAFDRANVPSLQALAQVERQLERPLDEIQEGIKELIRALDAALAEHPQGAGRQAALS